MALQHYSGHLGDFDYNTEEWFFNEHLRWMGGDKVCNLPKGVLDCFEMFSKMKLGKGFKFGDFDTSEVEVMESMFMETEFTEGFSLGDTFSTARAVSMDFMFACAVLPTGFSFGNKFDVSEVESADNMFQRCTIASGVVVPDLSEVQANAAFEGAILSSSFPTDNPWCTEISDEQLEAMFPEATFFNEDTGKYEDFINYCKSSR